MNITNYLPKFLRPVAYAYAETYERTAHSKDPVTFYVLDFPFLSGLRAGKSQISTTDHENYASAMSEEVDRGVRVISDRLPPGKRILEEVVITEDVPSPFKVEIQRKPIGRSE